VFDPEKILQNYRKKYEPSTSSFLRFGSYSDEENVDVDNVGFDLRFEQSLFRSKSEADLKEVVPDPTIFQTPIHEDFSREGKKSVFTTGTFVGQSSNTFVQNLTFGSFASQAKNLIAGHILGQSTMHTAHLPVMAAQFSPLVLPTILHDLLQNYAQRIRLYGAEEDITAQQHFDRFSDFVDLEEVDYEDIKMRLFLKSFSGEVKNWFRGLTTGTIRTYQELETAFLRKWEDKKNPLMLLTQYNSLKRDHAETIQELSARFMRVYGSIPAYVKPPAGHGGFT